MSLDVYKCWKCGKEMNKKDNSRSCKRFLFSSADENPKLKAQIRELESRLATDDTYIEIEHRKVVFVRGNDTR